MMAGLSLDDVFTMILLGGEEIEDDFIIEGGFEKWVKNQLPGIQLDGIHDMYVSWLENKVRKSMM